MKRGLSSSYDIMTLSPTNLSVLSGTGSLVLDSLSGSNNGNNNSDSLEMVIATEQAHRRTENNGTCKRTIEDDENGCNLLTDLRDIVNKVEGDKRRRTDPSIVPERPRSTLPSHRVNHEDEHRFRVALSSNRHFSNMVSHPSESAAQVLKTRELFPPQMEHYNNNYNNYPCFVSSQQQQQRMNEFQQTMNSRNLNPMALQSELSMLLNTVKPNPSELDIGGDIQNVFKSEAGPSSSEQNSRSLSSLMAKETAKEHSRHPTQALQSQHAAGTDVGNKANLENESASASPTRNKGLQTKRSSSQSQLQSKDWKNEEVSILLHATKLLVECELRTIADVVFKCTDRDPGKCNGRAAEKKLKRMKIFSTWKDKDKECVIQRVDEELEKLGPDAKEVPPVLLKTLSASKPLTKARRRSKKGTSDSSNQLSASGSRNASESATLGPI